MRARMLVHPALLITELMLVERYFVTIVSALCSPSLAAAVGTWALGASTGCIVAVEGRGTSSAAVGIAH